jgi:hypothetical protein
LNKLNEVIEGHREKLNRIFTYYCSFGEPLNTDKMPSSKFIKFLKDSKLLEPSRTGQGPSTPSNYYRNNKGQSIFNMIEEPH